MPWESVPVCRIRASQQEDPLPLALAFWAMAKREEKAALGVSKRA